ncbi:MAG: endolytic transglycosylase MltG [Elusimicrobiota bacterium]
MRRIAILLPVILLAAFTGAYVFGPGEKTRVDIPEGLSARQTTELLAERGVIHNGFLFRVILKLTGLDRRLKPGSYSLRVREWPTVTLRKLTLGLSDSVKVTIPEGFRASQVAERLGAAGIVDPLQFQALVEERKLEGRLFPSTYYFPLGYGAEKALAAMLAEFERQIGAHYASAPQKPALDIDSALIVASIVEREAVLKQERPIIAAVYLNRLKKKMPLQADPTVQYALGYWKKGMTRSDLLLPSPYNTYAQRGLPPGPICSPGLESFKAVLSPALTEALYFVADTTGGHLFSETNEEHVQARRMYKRELRKIKARLKKESAAAR